MDEEPLSEEKARAVLEAAIAEGRCAELLDALFQGAGCGISHSTGKLVIVPPEDLENVKLGPSSP